MTCLELTLACTLALASPTTGTTLAVEDGELASERLAFGGWLDAGLGAAWTEPYLPTNGLPLVHAHAQRGFTPPTALRVDVEAHHDLTLFDRTLTIAWSACIAWVEEEAALDLEASIGGRRIDIGVALEDLTDPTVTLTITFRMGKS